jgi:hypothetical protein
MPTRYKLVCTLIIFSSCIGMRKATSVNQGLSGYIYLASGNQMPGPGRQPNKGRGVSRAVYIFEPTSINNTEGTSPLFSHIKTRLIAQTKSDSTGYYAIKLPPGRYSVFIAENAQYFAAESDGTGTLNPVEIAPTSVTQKNFTINNKAAY